MRRLHTPQEAAQWLHSRVHGVLQADSRWVGDGDGFIAWPGGVRDGRQFVSAALAQGAGACLVEHVGAQAFAWATAAEVDDAARDNSPDAAPATVASYQGLRAACGPIAAAYYEHPSQGLDVLAITGTNGKTSSAWWLAHALTQLGQRCALVGTLGVGEVGQSVALEATGMTTPDPVLLQARLRDWANAGVNACAIEASSIGLAEHRLDGMQVRVALFTNLTQDHLDYHGDMAAYAQAKRALFDWPGLQAAVVNVDDAYGAALARELQQRTDLSVWTVSCAAFSDPAQPLSQGQQLMARHIQHGEHGLHFDVVEGAEAHPLHTTLVGHYNISNLLGVMAALRALGHSLLDVVQACCALPAVPGRMQVANGLPPGPASLAPSEPLVVVDYAHTPDAVAQAAQALLPLAQSRGGALHCVLGCGGDRDASKRPRMAAAAEQHAQYVMLTSDNPRSEDPHAILQQMQVGLQHPQRARVCVDRAQAIAQVVQEAGAQDVVLIAGKGHEDYQEIQGVQHPFDDVVHARAALAQRRVHG